MARIVAILLSLACPFIFMESVAQTADDAPTIAVIEEKIEAIATDSSIDDDARADAIDILNRAKNLIEAQSERSDRVAAYRTVERNLNQLLSDIDARQRALREKSDPSTADEPVEALQAQLTLQTATHRTRVEGLAELRNERLMLNGRAAEIADEVAAAREEAARLSGVADYIGEKPDALLEEARWLFGQASLSERTAAVGELQNELETIPARQSLVAAQIALAEAEIAHSDQTIEDLRRRLNASELGRAQLAIDAAQADVASLSPDDLEFSSTAEANLDLARKLRDGVLSRAALEQEIAGAKRKTDALTRSADMVDLVLDAGRLSADTAALLNSVRQTLPERADISALQFQAERRRGDTQLQLILWLDAQSADNRSPTDVSTAPSDAPLETAGAHERLVAARQKLLERSIDGARREIELLSEYDLALAQLGRQSQTLSALIDRHLLWLRTSERVNRAWLSEIPKGLAWALSPAGWAGALDRLLKSVFANLGASIFFALLLAALIGLRPKILYALDRVAGNVGHVGRDTYWTTPFGLLVTILLALPVPLTVGVVGWLMLAAAPEGDDFTRALAQTALLLSAVLLVLFIFREMCRVNGLFAQHFNWTEKARTRLLGNLRWFIRLQSIAIPLFGLTFFANAPGVRYGVGVIAFATASLGLAALTFQFLKPSGGVVSALKPGRTTSVLLTLLLPVAVVEPLFVGVLPFFGYFDTAADLQLKVLQSGALALGGAVLYGLAARMFMVGNRRFAYAQAREKRARQEAARASQAEAEASGETIAVAAEEALADADAISEQVRSILKLLAAATVVAALWFIWSPLIPALGYAGNMSLWTRVVTVDGAEVREIVTLNAVLTAVFILAGGLFAAKNIGGLLQISLFEPFGLDAGLRYAIASVTRYLIVAAAIVVGFSLLGAQWAQLQWVVAALGVGLGFGLQEIVANFVSGLIILFERPIRVGDIITIGDLRGVVNSIRIRATTITDFDNRQVILPNKTIITENVTNWTLEDDITRLLLRISVAYGSDIDEVRDIILKAVSSHPDVLDKPPPTVFFMAHGDSALLFEVRLFVAKPVKRLPTTHALNAAINAALREAGVNIPFPQTDVHVSLGEDRSDIKETAGEKLTKLSERRSADLDGGRLTTRRG